MQKPADVVQTVKDSGLRGRGGAGFPTGTKWSFLPNNIWPHYVVANADESEPGTFKDREILELNPYQFLEGLMLASFAVQANDSYVYFRGEFSQIFHKFEDRIRELEEKGFWETDSLEPITRCICTLCLGRGLTSAVKKQPCSNPLKGGSVSRACALHSRQWWVFSASRPSLTMWKRSVICPLSWAGVWLIFAPRGLRKVRAPRSSAFPAG